jgi:hypothetical protein
MYYVTSLAKKELEASSTFHLNNPINPLTGQFSILSSHNHFKRIYADKYMVD